MGDRISYDPNEIEEVGEKSCPDIANFYDDAGSRAASAGRNRGQAFGDHALGDTWSDLYDLFYEVIYETGNNVRAMGPTLKQIAEDQRILEGELSETFGRIEGDIEENGHSSEASENYENAPSDAPAPEDKDDRPHYR